MGDDLVLVVGGASGIGAAVAARGRTDGRRVVVWDLAEGVDIRCDVTDPGAVDAALAVTLARFGLPTEVTVTAGVGHGGALLDVGVDDWDRVQAVNVRGPLLVLRAVARAVLDAGASASMVATSSVSGRLADRGMGAYCASKAALSMVVRIAALEWAPSIRVNAVAPGVTDTPMLGGAPVDGGWLRGVAGRTALGRIGTPDDVAAAIAALHATGWVTGQVLEADGGLALHSPIMG